LDKNLISQRSKHGICKATIQENSLTGNNRIPQSCNQTFFQFFAIFEFQNQSTK
jgi:hypothetical protein